MNHEQSPMPPPLPRNVLEYPSETFRAMALVEGPVWGERQAAITSESVSEGEWQGSLSYAIEQAKKGLATKIEGHGNVSRWKIGKDGTVTFYRSIHADASAHADRARELGFEVRDLD